MKTTIRCFNLEIIEDTENKSHTKAPKTITIKSNE